MFRTRLLTPKAILLGVAFLSVAVCALTVYGATHVRWLGLRLAADEAGALQVEQAQGPSRAIPKGAREVTLVAGDRALPLTALDLLEEPDFLDSYGEQSAFYARQAQLRSTLAESSLDVRFVVTERGQTSTRTQRITPSQRPLSDLPAVFWFQLLAGASGCLLAGWVFAISARTIATQSFLLMGVTFSGFTAPAALYGTRELALDASLFQLLGALNHLFAFAFGGGLMALFLCYPRQLLGARGVWLITAIVVPWAILDVAQVLSPDLGYRIPILLEQLTAIALAGAQWRATKGDPRARAELRWLATSVLVGAGLFVFCTAGMSLMGITPPFAQGYAFGFFSLMYVGFALGLRRHQLLGLDEWAFRVLLWVLAAVLLIVLDLLMVLWLGEHSAMSMSAALLVAGFFYMPLRSWLWSRTLFRADAVESALFEGVIESAFAGSADLREQRWQLLLERYFQPAEIHKIARGQDEAVQIVDEGISMLLPATAGLPALRLAFPWRGRGLFARRHLTLASTLVTLMRKAEGTREAFARGVLVERQRIARDLHDNLGARLLSGLYAETIQDTREGIRHALSDMRSIVQELTEDRSYALGQLMADLRHETAERARTAQLTLDWPEPTPSELPLSPSLARNYTAVLRELVSNTIRHARATRLSVSTHTHGAMLETTLHDDGIGMQDAQSGNGLRSVRTRVRDLGGELSTESDARGTRWWIKLPLTTAGATDTAGSQLAPQRAP